MGKFMSGHKMQIRGTLAVVDDNKLELTYAADVLREAGHRVEAFSCAEDLLQQEDLNRFDVVVTDLVMDGMSGQKLLETLRQSKWNIEVIVSTMMSDADSAVRAMRAGAFDYLVKPINTDVLNLTVLRAMEKRRLLKQNIRLQRDLELALAGQRLLRGDSPQVIAETTLAALCKYLRMDAGIVEAGQVAMSVTHMDAGEAERVLQACMEQSNGTFAFCPVPSGLEHMQALYCARIGHDDDSMRVVIGKPRQKNLPDAEDIADANFLLSNAHNALVNERVFARARDEALRDSLTGLFNARYFEESLARAMSSGQFNDSALSVLFIDIDHFKEVNDRYGHLIGSKLLKELGKVLRHCVRENDLVARFGGDEFVILLEGANAQWAEVVGERVRLAVQERPFLAREYKNLHVTVCVGVASFPEHGDDPRWICELADQAMYQGKKNQRNVVSRAPLPTLTSHGDEKLPD